MRLFDMYLKCFRTFSLLSVLQYPQLCLVFGMLCACLLFSQILTTFCDLQLQSELLSSQVPLCCEPFELEAKGRSLCSVAEDEDDPWSGQKVPLLLD